MSSTSLLSSPTAPTAAAATVQKMQNGHEASLKESSTSSSPSSSLLSFLSNAVLSLILLVLNMALWTFFVVFLVSVGMNTLYKGPMTDLVDSYRRTPEDGNDIGFYDHLNDDITYYSRQCIGPEDISTQSNNDLMVPVNETRVDQFQTQVRDISMKHGALLIPKVLKRDTAQQLRDYLETNYHALDKVPYPANFWSEMSRLSLGLTINANSQNDEILLQALQEVGSNAHVQNSLEAMLGPNPAIVEISTLTTMYGATPQGIHTDSDYFGSSLLYARTFLHSYTMFMALQDTTPRMGATTVCPGTHMCANEELGWLCGGPFSNAFEASSNGQTGKDVGLFHQGDAFLFNQNVWHRGPANKDPNHPDTNRVMFIMTFVSRRAYEETRDVRQLGWGTYYYMRWDQWGHSFVDLLNNGAYQHLTTWFGLTTAGCLRALGLLRDSSKQGYTWVEHFARQLATKEDFYSKWELPEFQKHLSQTLGIPKYLLGSSNTKDWDLYLRQSLDATMAVVQEYEYKALAVAGTIYAVLYLLVLLLGSSTNTTKRSKVFHSLKRLFLGHVLIGILALAIYQAIVDYSYIGKKISSGQIWDKPFPNVNDDDESTATTTATTFPERMDVLIGSRYDAAFLGSFNDFLDYHAGNQHLRGLVKDFATNLPTDLALLGLQQVWQDEPLSNVMPRMLLQDYATGDWSVMSRQDAQRMLCRMIQSEKSSVAQNTWTHLKHVLADGRFGHGRETIMNQVWTPRFVEHWQGILFPDCSLNQRDKVRMVTSALPIAASEAPFRFQITSNTDLPLTVSISPSRSRRLAKGGGATIVSFSPSLPPPIARQKDLFILQEGDRVYGQYDDSMTMSEAVIRYIWNEEECLIQFVHDRTVRQHHVSALQRYLPFTQGDVVEVIYEDQSWHLATIVRASPFGVYDIEFQDDGEIETEVDPLAMRLVLADEKQHALKLQVHRDKRPPFVVGQTVYANYNRQPGEWFPGRISKITKKSGKRTYKIRYDDGDNESGVRPDAMIPMYMSPRQ